MIDDEINATREMNRRDAIQDALGAMADRFYDELTNQRLDDAVSFETHSEYMWDAPRINDSIQKRIRPATVFEVLSTEDNIRTAFELLFLCAKKGDIDARTALNRMATKAANDAAADIGEDE
jgi:hypothetical protein